MQYLVLLACPISMGAMMWMMMRGTGKRSTQPNDEARISMLEHELDELRARRDPDPARDPELSVGKR